jgi:hypothetical protein
MSDTRRYLAEVQRLPIQGARGVTYYEAEGAGYLAVPRLSSDAEGTPKGMAGGNSNTDVLILRRDGDRFVPAGRLPGTGGEDVEVFAIDGTAYAAVASIRMGSGPYNFKVGQPIYVWREGGWKPFQTIIGDAARQWRHFEIDGVPFLALAQGRPGSGVSSSVYRWSGREFELFQSFPTKAGYNLVPFEHDGTVWLAHAENEEASRLYKWTGERFEETQLIDERDRGRAYDKFTANGETYIAAANIKHDSLLLRWDGQAFVPHQVLDGGTGGREFAVIHTEDGVFAIRVNFVTGGPNDPHPVLKSQVYKLVDDRLEVVEEFDTVGATDVISFRTEDGGYRVVVASGLNGDIGFNCETVVYAFDPKGAAA